MNQRLSTSFFGLFFLVWLFFTSASNAGNAISHSAPSDKKAVEATFTQGIQCLERADLTCAKMALLRIPAQNIYAKILDGAIAAAENDVDKSFRLLLPIQVSGASQDSSLLPSAIASLHASLAQAYDQQSDTLRSLEQRILAERHWLAAAEVDVNQIRQNQKNIWNSLIMLDRSQLVEMRGESFNTTIQGWLDLALSAQTSGDLNGIINDWRKVYPDHTAQTNLILTLTPRSSTPQTGITPIAEKKVALLLPFSSAAFYTAADAIERGFMAAKEAAKDDIEVVIYATTGDKDLITGVYQKAISEGANFVVGPLARDEITALTTGELRVPTLALNQAEANLTLDNLYSLGLSIDTEASQIAKLARDSGMQTAVIVAADMGVAPRMAKAFEDAWVAEGGQLIFQANINEETSPEQLQAQLQSHPADMILLATHPELGRAVRGYLDITTPTYGFSHLYSGVNYEPEDAALLAVRFIDLPWMLTSGDRNFDIYKEAASNLPEGMMQRWFALGVDAYQVISVIAAQSGQKTSIRGLTGRIQIGVGGNIERTLAVGRFTGDGVVLEQAP
jgi:uncharacterized protein